MKILLVYPHGLGDCILATPALKAYKKSTGNFIGFAMLERFKSSELFKHNPYIDEILYTKDMWNDFDNVDAGRKAVTDSCKKMADEKGYDEVRFVNHSKTGSKILDTANELEVSLDDVHTEVYLCDADKNRASEFVKKFGDVPYGFVHTKTGLPLKDLPDNYGKSWLRKIMGIDVSLEVGVDFKYTDFNINVQFEILKRAAAVCVADSVFYHACAAFDKKIDFVYFKKGKRIFDRVKPIHKVDQNVFYELPRLHI